jgi:hypothetical protein
MAGVTRAMRLTGRYRLGPVAWRSLRTDMGTKGSLPGGEADMASLPWLRFLRTQQHITELTLMRSRRFYAGSSLDGKVNIHYHTAGA